MLHSKQLEMIHGVKKAYQDYKKQAEQGDAWNQYQLAIMYKQGIGHYGQGIPQNMDKAIYWYKESAKNGYPHAPIALGQIFYEKGGLKNEIKAIHWYKQAADKGHPTAIEWIKNYKADWQQKQENINNILNNTGAV